MPPAARRSPPSRQGTANGSARGNIFGPHKRQSSVAESASSSGEPGGFSGGAALAQQTTNSSFTGVGTPLVAAGGALAREVTSAETTLLTTLRDLFSTISRQPKSLGTVAPQAFINQLKRDNEFFRSTLHQDAHEFLNFLINSVAEALERDEKKRAADEGRALSASRSLFQPSRALVLMHRIRSQAWSAPGSAHTPRRGCTRSSRASSRTRRGA